MGARASWSPEQRLVATGLALLALSLTAYAVLRLTFGERPAHVNVRWAPAVDERQRIELERRYHLDESRLAEGRTFSYELTDLSKANIRALVLDPAVEDTHQIHRTAFRIGRLTPRGRYPGRGALSGRLSGPLLEAAAVMLFLAALAVLALPALQRVGPASVQERAASATRMVLDLRTALHALVRVVTRGIPEASPEAVGAFRIAFGLALVTSTCFPPIAGSPPWLRPLLFMSGALFVAGAAAPAAYALLTFGTVVWATTVTEGSSHHPVASLLLAMFCLLGSRWSDAWSVDAWWRRRRGTLVPARSARVYGYTLWLPGFVLGVAFAAAAIAKLRDSGLAWVLNGTVKYHFLSDAHMAPLDWGLRVGQYPWLAVALSLGTIVIEALVIAGVCSRSYRYRGLAGVAAAAILTGFGLLQGIVWPGWWVLLLSFPPWHLIRRAAGTARRGLPVSVSLLEATQAVLILFLAGQQIIVSALRLEARPVISTYDMYATTYASPDDYVAKSGAAYWIVSDEGRECRVERLEAEAVAGSTSTPATGAILRRCFGESASAPAVTVEKRELSIDWERWQVGPAQRTPLGPPGI